MMFTITYADGRTETVTREFVENHQGILIPRNAGIADSVASDLYYAPNGSAYRAKYPDLARRMERPLVEMYFEGLRDGRYHPGQDVAWQLGYDGTRLLLNNEDVAPEQLARMGTLGQPVAPGEPIPPLLTSLPRFRARLTFPEWARRSSSPTGIVMSISDLTLHAEYGEEVPALTRRLIDTFLSRCEGFGGESTGVLSNYASSRLRPGSYGLETNPVDGGVYALVDGEVVLIEAPVDATVSLCELGAARDTDRVVRELRDDALRWARYRRRELLAARYGWNPANVNPDHRPRRERAAQPSSTGGVEGYERHRHNLLLHAEDREVIPLLPELPHGTRASRRWGIEVETGAGRNLRPSPAGWEYKDDGSLESAYGDTYIHPNDCDEAWAHDVSSHMDWITTPGGHEHQVFNADDYIDPRDCDYCGGDEDWGDDDDCVEAVSPILTSFHSRGLEQICEDLEPHPTTTSAGIHVHVEANDLTSDQLRTLLFAYDQVEHIIEESYRREERGYCRRRSARELLAMLRGNSPDMPRGERYVTVNLNSLNYHGTVEFRAMGPVYNYDYLIRWAMFCREMVNAATKTRPGHWTKVRTWDDLTAMLNQYGVEYPKAADEVVLAALEGIAEAQASEVVEV